MILLDVLGMGIDRPITPITGRYLNLITLFSILLILVAILIPVNQLCIAIPLSVFGVSFLTGYPDYPRGLKDADLKRLSIKWRIFGIFSVGMALVLVLASGVLRG